MKATISETEVNLIDTTVYKRYPSSDTLYTRIYFNLTDTHALLNKSSFAPTSVFKGIAISTRVTFCSSAIFKREGLTMREIKIAIHLNTNKWIQSYFKRQKSESVTSITPWCNVSYVFSVWYSYRINDIHILIGFLENQIFTAFRYIHFF